MKKGTVSKGLFLLAVVFAGVSVYAEAKNQTQEGIVPSGIPLAKARFVGLAADYVEFGQFYHQLPDSGKQSGWYKTSVAGVFHFDYLQLGLSLDLGGYAYAGEKGLLSGVSHRMGIDLSQSYENDDSLSIRFFVGHGPCFPGRSFNGLYTWEAGQNTRMGIDVWGEGYGEDELYFLLSGVYVRRIGHHELEVRPGLSFSGKRRINVEVRDKISTGKSGDSVSIHYTAGYHPGSATYVKYEQIADKRYSLSGEGKIGFLKNRMSLICTLGTEYVKGTVYNASWYLQLGLQYVLS